MILIVEIMERVKICIEGGYSVIILGLKRNCTYFYGDKRRNLKIQNCAS